MTGIVQALTSWANNRPDDIAITTNNVDVTVADLIGRAGGISAIANRLPSRVGLLTSDPVDWIAADVGLWAAGSTVVPLPDFFSDSQLGHMLQDAGLDTVLTSTDHASRVRALGATIVPFGMVPQPLIWTQSGGRRIIYTSGSSGRPKDVVLDLLSIMHTSAVLARAIGANSDDVHLSVLPQAMLLESICGIYIPTLARARVHVVSNLLGASPRDLAEILAAAAADVRPTTTVLVPEFLAAWVHAATAGAPVPNTLRVVAVGGAPVSEDLVERAWALGIPAYEGYGLSECGSVVSANVPGSRRAGTVGRPLQGFEVSIADDGEIVVRSPSVMDGYLDGGRLNGGGMGEANVWPTGDVGILDTDGYLSVQGRKDNLIVLSNGRNVSPEWIETMLLSPPTISRAVILADQHGELAALVESGTREISVMTREAEKALVERSCAHAPPYARPRRVFALPTGTLAAEHLLTPNGKVRRAAVWEWFLSNVENVHADAQENAAV